MALPRCVQHGFDRARETRGDCASRGPFDRGRGCGLCRDMLVGGERRRCASIPGSVPG
jgi:hypothetical protein